MAQNLIKYLIFCSLVLLAIALYKRDALPLPSEISSTLLAEPDQQPVAMPSFGKLAGGITYEVKPLYSYDLHGLVVSRHDSNVWWDYIHKEWNDSLNVVDLCVVWGNNVRNHSLGDIKFSSGQFVCNFETSSRAAYEAFDQTAISNNHLLTSDKSVAEALRSVRVGDQIHFRGYLAEYAHNHGFPFKRGTSTVRNDTGNGACETVYVEFIEIVQRGNGIWHKLVWISSLLLVASMIGWFSLPPHVRAD